MERVTANYLEGEQSICDVWARYIDESGMTLGGRRLHPRLPCSL